MIIFPKKDIIPIIIPQVYFNDKYNDVNSYNEMNPSLFIEENGNITILVRCINYKKYESKLFTLYDTISNSIYYTITGKINDKDKLDIEKFDYNILEYTYTNDIFPAYWKGLEDIRFIDKNNVLVIVPELNPLGNPSVFKAELINNQITNFISCNPNKVEKNWMPYFDNNVYKVIYRLNPFIIKSIENDDMQEIEIPELIKNKLEGYHGSTNGLYLNKFERLFLIHINKEKVIHRWIIFNIKTQNVLVSEEFTFFKNSYIEFNCSLSKYNDRIFITIGVNDNKSFIIETCKTDIMEIFHNYYNEENYPTIVTMLYDIRSMENVNIERNRKLESYIDFSKQFLLKQPFPVIFFIDDNEETYDAIYNARKEFELLDKTHIYICDFKTTYFYKYFSRLQELQKKFHIINGEIEHETPLYIILNNNKFDCIDMVIKENPFNSSHLIWMDFGINHVAQNTEYISEWINKVPDKIKQLCINPFTENTPFKQHFEFIYHNMAGGLFSGSLENMAKYSELFKKKTEEIYNDNWYQIDEAVMTMVQRENPELFDLYYGDYIGIISNYLSPIHSIALILNGCQKYIDINKTKEAYTILCYCCKYFENNPHCGLVFYFIEQNIIVDYFNNDKLLLILVINLINLKINSDNKFHNDIIHDILEKNKANIDYYLNKNLINNFEK
jgi:hypothetical protein